MHHVDRNSGILNPQEKFSADERRSYQEKFLREVVSHAYAAGTPLMAAMDGRGIKPSDLRTTGDLQDPHHKEKGPFGGSESSASVRRIPHCPAVGSGQDTPVTGTHLRSWEKYLIIGVGKALYIRWGSDPGILWSTLSLTILPQRGTCLRRGFGARGDHHPYWRR